MLSPPWVPIPLPLSSGLLHRHWCLKKPQFQASVRSHSTGATAGGEPRRRRYCWSQSSPHSPLRRPFQPWLPLSEAQWSWAGRFCHCLHRIVIVAIPGAHRRCCSRSVQAGPLNSP
ncbi:hypothetical protein PIB30_074381 [Stylosanthes scabra]|nr:hypothetical protein [Stylosanthes scabra]